MRQKAGLALNCKLEFTTFLIKPHLHLLAMFRLLNRFHLKLSPSKFPSFSPIATIKHHYSYQPSSAMSTSGKSPLSQPVKIACIQLLSGKDKSSNLLRAREKVLEAAQNKANIVVLPECFNSPYGCEFFDKYAEPIPSRKERENSANLDEEKYPSFSAIRKMAIDAKVFLVAGSIPERSTSPPSGKIETSDPNQAQVKKTKEKAKEDHTGKQYLYNTSLTFNPEGSLIGLHRKIHLFDIDIPGKITFIESSVLSPGHTPTIINIPPYGDIGVQICYDVRFPELTTIYARKGAFATVIPGAFNLTTGPLHWELLARGRANDNQVYVAMCSPARTGPDVDGYKAWGESMLVDPMGKVLDKASGGDEGIVYAELKPEEIVSARAGIPVTLQRRWDVYPDVSVKADVGDGLDLID